MKIDVFDSYATTDDETLMHFDIFVETGTSEKTALSYGQQWLESIGLQRDILKLSRCNFCHTEAANPEIAEHIQQHHYFILQMEGCPQPYQFNR